jgi:hypothetical protein
MLDVLKCVVVAVRLPVVGCQFLPDLIYIRTRAAQPQAAESLFKIFFVHTVLQY